ncbi:glutamine synthetase III family protein [Aureibacter tunicatorum]|uniref:Glutamine synthetase n=1 Tax=Aureibacter tunicatorum TaxID=866807 RepID=A0AAE3XM08_9BACT|nr:glutamine synthetase III [Aureibacter tunicatorum]MDR6239402.1 glutamine synthetase [Aureibacter tunicatorum]BDD04675.1 glutamine synthetase [Aureibacter tunicatorum]
MANLRTKALEQVEKRKVAEVNTPSEDISKFFGVDSFGLDQMRETLAPATYKEAEDAILNGKKISPELSSAIAAAVKTWAISKGAKHYTHWFQPLTGDTAEKHDTFFDAMKGIEIFKGSALIRQEPDASSFPNGGIRSTFEARGYTAWDPSSPMFVWGETLCIPTIFVSYTGESLDNKAPLLKSVDTIDRAATRVCKFFDRNVSKITPSLGCEQEYFVVDKAFYNARPDLVLAGRTVFGHNPAKGQQLDDHYFGSIPNRVLNYMKDFEAEALKKGIPVSTRHNEVAPSQFEVAPLFEEINKATDHNQLLIDIMNKVAERHDLKVLFHEKPFAGLNGSGKHNNWSLITNTGVNLFQPSSSAKENLQFLTFFVNTLMAVYEHGDLLRASIASAGNDHRLGANEAPPAIISAFIGSQLSAVLDELENNGNIKVEKGDNMYMKLGIDKIPEILLDNTDRNRTSPFAFTGNKFEFRAPGSDINCAAPMTVLNVIVADRLNTFADEVDALVEKGEDRRIAIVNILRDYIKASKAIRFEGDGYSKAWEEEAEGRGLPNVKNTPEALDAYLTEKSIQVFSHDNVLTEKELEARREILLENYIRKIQIESRVMGDLASNHVIPTAVKYQNILINNAKGLKELGVDNSAVLSTIEKISMHLAVLRNGIKDMTNERKRVNDIEDVRDQAIAYCHDIKDKYFDEIRRAVDKLELYVDDEDWPLVKYREMLFLR